MNKPNFILKVDSSIRHFIHTNIKGVCVGTSRTHWADFSSC